MKKMNYIEAITEGMREEMKRDPRVFLFGEDIGWYGGVFKATKGLYQEFGEMRVLDSPLSESLIAGACVGAAMVGMRPIPEIQFSDFITCAFDQIIQQAAKIRYRTGGTWTAPMVIRVPYGGAVGGGLYHSQSNEAWFVHQPGLQVVVPGTPYDAKGLLKAGIRGEDPVVYFEHKKLYRSITGEIPEEDYTVPIGKAEIRRQGKGITICAYGLMMHRSVEAADLLAKEGISVEVIDLRSLLPLDEEKILESVKKTGKILTVHEDYRMCGMGAEITTLVIEKAFEYLDAAPVRVVPPDTPAVPFHPGMEDFWMPDAKKIAEAARKLAAY
jgi:2-oxoisovalerate dehydrogenase E1 component beta subunit